MKLRSLLPRFLTYLAAGAAVLITVAMVQYPEIAYRSAISGLKVWWEIVFPALLPFFVISEILMALGVVHFMGVFLEPLMRPLFNVPGVGSFVMAMGLASGYPIGAILTAKLRRQNLCTPTEGERLMSCANTADPLFMVGAVAVGMFGNQKLGVTIALAHYISTIIVGLLLRFYRRGDPITPGIAAAKHGNVFVRALQALYQARQDDGRPFGQVLGDAIRSSVNSLLAIGGFIILFSVTIRILYVVGVINLIALALAAVFKPLGVTEAMLAAITSGLFEITIGTQLASQAAAPLGQRLMVTSGIIAWSGLSVLAQVASMIQGTGMRMTPFVVARFAHAILAGGVTVLLLGPGYDYVSALSLPAFIPEAVAFSWSNWPLAWQYLGAKFAAMTALLFGSALGLSLLNGLQRLKSRFFH